MINKQETDSIIEYCNKAIDIEKEIYSIECSISNINQLLSVNPKNYRYKRTNKQREEEITERAIDLDKEGAKKLKEKMWLEIIAVILFIGVATLLLNSMLPEILWIITVPIAIYIALQIISSIANSVSKEAADSANSLQNNYIHELNNYSKTANTLQDDNLISYFQKLSDDEYNLKCADYDQLQVEKNKLEEILNKYNDKRNSFYDKNIIYKKYQNFAAISSIKDYLESGRCYELGGPDGAYNKYDLEVSNHEIISKIDMLINATGDISQSLLDIKNNQYTLYNAIRSIENSIVRLSNKLDKLDYHEALLKSIEKNAESLKTYAALDYYLK